MEKAGAAAVHMEDQVSQKRCGHRPNKEIVSTQEMVDRITAAVDARTDPDFFIMARTDAFAQQELGEWGAAMVLYPLSAFRAMNRAAENVYQSILDNGDQKAVLEGMQTRMELYDYFNDKKRCVATYPVSAYLWLMHY